MISTRLVLAALLALVATGCLHPVGTPNRPAVTSFDIEGTRAVSAGELRDHLATQPSDKWFWQETRYYDEDAFANDRRRIVRYYESRGYYGVRILSADVTPDGDRRVKIKVVVEEGQPTRVASIELPGLEKAPEAAAKLKKLPLSKGDVFTEVAYDETKAAILKALTTTGWAKAEVRQHADVDPARREARVQYTVVPGERYRFGSVFVAGASAIPRARIREEAQAVVKPGATYDSSDLGKAQARVFDLGVFGGVRVGAGSPDEAHKDVPVVVSVRESPFRTIRAGPGFILQQTRYELDAMAGWSHRNWLGGLRKLNLDLRAGYAWLPTWFNPTKQGIVGLGSADFTQPSMFTRDTDLNVRVELERGREQAYDFWAQRFRIGTPIRFGRTASIIPSYNLEVFELTGSIPSDTDPRTGNVLLLQTCPGDPCVLSYFEQRATVDLRDDPILTTKGAYFSVALQEGFRVFGAGSPYLRLLPEARLFLSLPWRLVLATRARIGIAHPIGGTDVPIVAKFTSGGPNLMRGYYSRALSPVVFFPKGNQYIPVGGNGLVDGSAELRFPISGNIGGAVFLDFGNVTVEAADALNLSKLQYAVGAGLRYMTIFGPVRLDVAARLPKPNGDQPTVQQLALGGSLGSNASVEAFHADPIVSVHLSIGEAF